MLQQKTLRHDPSGRSMLTSAQRSGPAVDGRKISYLMDCQLSSKKRQHWFLTFKLLVRFRLVYGSIIENTNHQHQPEGNGGTPVSKGSRVPIQPLMECVGRGLANSA